MSAEGSFHAELRLTLDGNERAVDASTRSLCKDLQRAGATAELARSSYEPSTRGIGPEVLGLIQLFWLPSVSSKLLDCLQSWITSRKDAVVRLRIERDGETLELEFTQTKAAFSQLRQWVDMDR